MNYNFLAMDMGGGGGNPMGMFMPLILMFAIFYFMIIRPQSKRAKEREKMLGALAKGDKIVTSGGLHGTIAAVEDTTVLLQVTENVKLKIDKTAIALVVASKSGEQAPAVTK